MFTSSPAPVLLDLGITAHRTVRLRLANGQIQRRELGNVTAELNGETETVLCVLGDPDSPPIIGAHALEAFLLAIDPTEQQLVPVEALWG